VDAQGAGMEKAPENVQAGLQPGVQVLIQGASNEYVEAD
jgi:hypothetical protein